MKFSVIVPTYNRCDSLKKTIESIRRQDFTDFEIIVVNDGSTDETHSYVNQIISQTNITLLNQPNLGPARARNAGISKAHGEFLAFTDDDCVVPTDWLSRIDSSFSASNADIVGGVVVNRVSSMYAEVSQQITNYFVRTLSQNSPSPSFLTSNNAAYRSTAIKRAGCFDERFIRAGGEERALNSRIIDGGGTSVLLSDCVVEHYHTFSLWSFLRQQFNYGHGSFLLYRVVGKELQAPPAGIPFRAHRGLIAELFRDGAWLGAKKFFLYLLAQKMVLFGYLLEAVSPRNIHGHAAR